MAFLSIIRRWHERDHVPIREIFRRTGVSRNTIRKCLRSGMIEPTFPVPDRPSKLDPYAEKLSEWLRREAGRPRACRTSTRRSLSSRHRSAPTRDRLIGRRQRSSSQSSRRAATGSWRRTAGARSGCPAVHIAVAAADGRVLSAVAPDGSAVTTLRETAQAACRIARTVAVPRSWRKRRVSAEIC